MPYYKFKDNDIFYNTLETHPKVKFDINDNKIYYNNLNIQPGEFTSNVTDTPVGYLSLYELNIDRPSDSLIYPFITKDGNFEALGGVSITDNATAYQYGDVISGSYPMSASISREKFVANHGNLTPTGSHVLALKNTLNYYTPLSDHYAFSSSLGDKKIQELTLIYVPSIFYGSEIRKGTVDLKFYITGTLVGRLQDPYYNGELVQTDGTAYAETNGSASVAGVVLYTEGIIVLTGSWDLAPDASAYSSLSVSSGLFSESGTGLFETDIGGDWETSYVGSELSGSGSYSFSGSVDATGSYTISGSGDHSGSYSGSTSYGTGSYCISGSGVIDLISGSSQFTGSYVIGTGSNTTISGTSGYNLTGTYASYYFCGSGTYYVSGSSIHTLSGSGVGTGSLATASYYISDAQSYNITGSGTQYSLTGSGGSASFSGTGSMQLTGSGEYSIIGSASSDTFNIKLLSDPTWLDFAAGANDGNIGVTPSANFVLEFEGSNNIPTITMFANASKENLNYSTNQSYIDYASYQANSNTTGSKQYTENNKVEIFNSVSSSFYDYEEKFKHQTFISKIGIYDEKKNLIAVANLATPIKKTGERDFTFKLKLDI